jgi:hypothetical protein
VARRAACRFRLVHRKIGVAQDFDGTALLVGSYCDDTDASTDTGIICSGAVTFVLNDYRFFKRCVQPVDDVLDIGGLYGRGHFAALSLLNSAAQDGRLRRRSGRVDDG